MLARMILFSTSLPVILIILLSCIPLDLPLGL